MLSDGESITLVFAGEYGPSLIRLRNTFIQRLMAEYDKYIVHTLINGSIIFRDGDGYTLTRRYTDFEESFQVSRERLQSLCTIIEIQKMRLSAEPGVT